MHLQAALVLSLASLVFTAAAQTTTTVPTPQAQPPLRVPLDSTGVASWKVLNPVKLENLNGRSLTFENTTGDRTFVVTMPFVYSTTELTTAYTLANQDRGGRKLDEIICPLAGVSGSCRQSLRTLEGLRALLESITAAKAVALETCTTPTSDCVVETTFWTSTCVIDEVSMLTFARAAEIRRDDDPIAVAVANGAKVVVRNLFSDSMSWPGCVLDVAVDRQKKLLAALETTSQRGDGMENASQPIEELAKATENTAVKSRFGSARIDLTRRALESAIRAAINEHYDKLSPVFSLLEERRIALARLERDAASDADRAQHQCQLREIEAAAKLLVSYHAESTVPYRGFPEESCDAYRNTGGKYATAAAAAQAISRERRAEQGIEITDCDPTASPMTCNATATIPPYQSATFSTFVLRHHPTPRIRFTVAFFGESEPPANANGFVQRDGAPADVKPKGQFGFALGADGASAFDPDETLTGTRRHSAGGGSATVQFSGPFEAGVTLQFKRGDFGGAAATTEVQASQYQAKVFSERGVTFQFGRMLFAKPASGIALSAFGEGFQAAWRHFSLGYMIGRESDNLKDIADRRNNDNDLCLFQVRNFVPALCTDVQLRGGGATGCTASRFIRGLDFTLAYGEEKRDVANPTKDAAGNVLPRPRPYTHWTFGPELRFGFETLPSFAGSFAVFHSIRNVRPPHPPDPNLPPAVLYDGRGTAGLLRLSWTRFVPPLLSERSPRRTAAYGLSALLGLGSGDKAATDNRDEGYLGETAGFANDLIFLSAFSKSDTGKAIGRGLANKLYVGGQYTDSRWSLAAAIAHLFNRQAIESRATIISLHTYRFRRPVNGSKNGGIEADMEFTVETPKNVRWSIVGGYYLRSDAVENLGMPRDPWTITAKVAVNITGR